MSDRPKWVMDLWVYLTDTLVGELPEDGRDDWLHDDVIDAVNAILCDRYGHDIVDDQCGIPEHRFCAYCSKKETDIQEEQA